MAVWRNLLVMAALASVVVPVIGFRAPFAHTYRGVQSRVSPLRPGLRHGSLLMQESPEENDRWASASIDENKEKLESVKAAGLSLVAGSLAWAPLSLIETSSFYPSDAFSAQWELAHDGLALMCALFGLVYRYAVRQDQNPQLKQGVVGAFVITRAWAMLQADSACTAVPLQCGAPLSYFNWQMIAQGSGAAVESAVAFGVAAVALEFAFSKGWVGRFPST